MTPLATVIVASAGVYAYCAFHYGALWCMRPEAREHGAFAALSGSLCLFALAAAVVADADEIADAAIGQRLQYVVGMASAVAFVIFCARVSGDERPRLERAAIAIAVAAGIACAMGLFVDPAIAAPSYDGAAIDHGGRPAAALLWPARLALAAILAIALVAVVGLGRAALRDRTLWPTFAAACIPFLAASWDVVVRWSAAPLPLISSIAPVLAAIAISWALVGRFGRVDAELAARTEELARSYETLRHAQQELVRTEQLAAVGELSAVIAHEVRNPLAIIRNASGGLRRSELAASEREALLGILDEEANRLNRLVQDLLTYARPVTPEPATIDVAELVGRAVGLAREGHADRANIEFVREHDPSITTIEADPALLRHALINIVENAMQAMPEGGTIAISCRPADLEGRPAIAIGFRDEGEGMDTLVRSKARDPFFTTRASGTGLGLAIVDRVARVHGGRVEIESRHGHGTTVTLVLPETARR